MKNNFTLVKSFILLLVMSFSCSLMSQIEVKFSSNQSLVAVGQSNYEVDVRISNFTDIVAMQYMVTWDPTVLQIDTLPNLSTTVPGLHQSIFALPNETVDMIPGRLLFSWTNPSAVGISFPSNQFLFTMSFTVVGNECDVTALNIEGDAAFPIEAIRDDFTDVGGSSIPYPVEVAGTGCNQFNTSLACNDMVNFALDPNVVNNFLTADMMLEGGPYNYANMVVSPASVSCLDLGDNSVTVTDVTSGNSCWGVLSVEGAHCEEFVNTMACNSLINVSVTPWGAPSDLTPDMILEGGPYDLNVMSVTPAQISCDDIGTPIIATVLNNETGITCWAEVVVEDKTPPVAVVKQNIVISLSTDPMTGEIGAKLYAESVDNGSHDNCTDVTLSPAFWTFDCADIGYQTVFLEVTDAYGNSNKSWTEVEIEYKLTGELICPDDIVVDCTVDINDPLSIENVLGQSSIENGCAVPYTDVFGYDANGDGDTNDTFILNGEEVTEWYTPCNFGAVVRTWGDPSTPNSTCQQIIGVTASGTTFDATMIDWPYSKNANIDLGDNDSGVGCSVGCPIIEEGDITLDYDMDGNLIGSTIVTNCVSALCEEPLFNANSCSLVGYSVDDEYFNLANGDLKVLKTFVVIDWCQFDPAVSSTDGRWEYVVKVTVLGGASAVNFYVPEVTGAKGDQVCVPVRVNNFRNIDAIQGSLNWNEHIADFASVQAFGLPGLNNSSFGLHATDDGSLSFLWLDQTGNTPVTLNDGDVLFSLCFEIVGDEGDKSLLNFVDFPTPMEASSNFVSQPVTLNNGSITVGASDCTSDIKKPTPYCINLSTALLNNGEVELWAIDFNVGSFDNCTAENNLRYTFTDVSPENDPSFDANNSSSRKIYTSADIVAGTNTIITETMYVWDENGNSDYCQINLRLVDNSGTDGDVTLDLLSRSGSQNSTVCVPLEVSNFASIETMQATIAWDETVATFESIQNINLPGFSEGLTNPATPGKLSFLWFDATGTNPVTLADNTTLFEICFDLIGDPGSSSALYFTDSPVNLQVSKPNPTGAVNVVTSSGSLNVINGNCSIDESDIIWPAMNVDVYAPNANEFNASTLLTPDNLLTYPGIEIHHVRPVFDVDDACQGSIAYVYEDVVIPAGTDQVKIVRTWTVVDWNTGNVFTFTQIIKNYISSQPICDTLPNSAPVGDCASGHTLDDDVEWPDDVTIEDHRFSPVELVSVSGIDPNDAEPIFYNSPDVYASTYRDDIVTLSQTNLLIARVWNVTRTDFAGFSWSYTQMIDIDLSDFGTLVTISTITDRPLSSVALNETQMTNDEGLAYVEEGDGVDPKRIDELRNGLNIKDLMLMQANVIGEVTLNEYELIAADYNSDNNISALDVFQLESVLLGITNESNVDWMFEDVTTEIDNGIELKGHYVAVKPGDIDDSADIGLENPVYSSEKLIIEDKLLNAGETYLVPLYIGNNMNALGTELNLTFNKDMVEITDVNSDLVFGSISYNIINDNRIAMITENFDLSVESIDKETPLLTIEVKALQNGLLKDVFGVSDVNESFILDSEYNLIKIEEVIEGQIGVGNENLDLTLDIDVYPNPVLDYLTIDDNDDFYGETMNVELFDVTGKSVIRVQNEKQIDVKHLVPGMYVYKITIDNKFISGRILKQ